MADVLTPKQRSFCMSRIRGRDTKPEVALRKKLWQLGLRYRLGAKLPGKPDLVFPKHRVVVFIDGCFWHGCAKHMVEPKSNKKFWLNKIQRNKARDAEVNRILKKSGWNIIRIWEHEIRADIQSCGVSVSKRIVKGLAK